MAPELIAILAAMVYSLSFIVARRGLRYSNSVTVTMVSFLVQCVIFGTAVAVHGVPAWHWNAVWLIVAAASFQPLVRQMTYLSMQKIGAARSGFAARHPSLLGRPHRRVTAGRNPDAAAVARQRHGHCGYCRDLLARRQGSAAGLRLVRAVAPDRGFPGGCRVPPPARGLGSLAGTAVLRRHHRRGGSCSWWVPLRPYRDWPNGTSGTGGRSGTLSAAGACEALGGAGILYALRGGEVVVIAPITATLPMWTLLGTVIFLRDMSESPGPPSSGRCSW